MGANKRWMWGGALLILGTVMSTLPVYGIPAPVIAIGGILVTAAAWILFAIGADRAVARRTAVVALFVLGLWPLVGYVVWPLVATSLGQTASVPPGVIAAGFVDALIPVAAAAVAAVDVWRGDRVPAPFRRLPVIALALCAGPAVLVNVLGVSGPGSQDALLAIAAIGNLCRMVALVGLGVVAILAGMPSKRMPEASTVVYSSEPVELSDGRLDG